MIFDKETIDYFYEVNRILWELSICFHEQGFTEEDDIFKLFDIQKEIYENE
jgi:hypothetical protein